MTKPTAILLWTVAGALSALAMSPSAAMAGCRLPLSSTSPGEAGLDLLADLGALADEPTPPPAPRCGGIRCPGDSTPAPTPTIIDPAKCWNLWARLVLDAPPASPYPVSPPASLHPSHGGPPPFRPPQFPNDGL